MDDLLEKYLKPIETNWQPSDLLPNSRNPEFMDEVKEIQELAKDMDYDLLTVLIGDTITEEALHYLRKLAHGCRRCKPTIQRRWTQRMEPMGTWIGPLKKIDTATY